MGIEKLDLPDVLSLSLDGIQPQQAGDAGHSTEVGDIHVSLILVTTLIDPSCNTDQAKNDSYRGFGGCVPPRHVSPSRAERTGGGIRIGR